VKEIGMPIDPAALARNLSSLAALDAEQDLPRAMQQITSAAKALLGVDGAGLMRPMNAASCAGRPPPTRRPRSSRKARSAWGRALA
jgi:hypothetical protein